MRGEDTEDKTMGTSKQDGGTETLRKFTEWNSVGMRSKERPKSKWRYEERM